MNVDAILKAITVDSSSDSPDSTMVIMSINNKEEEIGAGAVLGGTTLGLALVPPLMSFSVGLIEGKNR